MKSLKSIPSPSGLSLLKSLGRSGWDTSGISYFAFHEVVVRGTTSEIQGVLASKTQV